jgi:hypothetical protein
MQRVTIVLEAFVSDETGADLRAHRMAEWPAVRGLLGDCEPAIRVVVVTAVTTAADDSTVGVSGGTQSSPEPHPWNCSHCGEEHGPVEACLLGLIAAVVRDRGEISAEALAIACEQTSTKWLSERWGGPAADELEGLAKMHSGSRGG